MRTSPAAKSTWREALLPILADRVASLKSDQDARIWETALEGQTGDAGITVAEAAKLNRFLHIADGTGTTGAERGAVVKLPDTYLPHFERTFGLFQAITAAKQFGCSVFVEADQNYRWVLVQVQAICDFAQRQPGPLPFVLGLEMPVASVSKSFKAPDAMISCPPFESRGAARILHINTRFQLTIPVTAATALTAEYRLREALLSDMAYQVHSYGARPGMISFREVKPKAPPAAANKDVEK